MSNAIAINTLEELKKFLDKNGVLEIVIRGQKKRFKAFQKVLICDTPEKQEQGLAEKVIKAINKNTHLNEKSLKILGDVAKLEKLDLILNGLNLCSTCVGFVIMCKKLDKMSDKINHQLQQIQKSIKQVHDVQNDFEFNKDGTKVTRCANGQEPKSCSYNPKTGQCTVSFHRHQCDGCPYADQFVAERYF